MIAFYVSIRFSQATKRIEAVRSRERPIVFATGLHILFSTFAEKQYIMKPFTAHQTRSASSRTSPSKACPASHPSDTGKCRTHSHSHTSQSFARPVLSAALLFAGILFRSFGTNLSDSHPAIEFIWYLAALLPVGGPVMLEAIRSLRNGDCFNEFSLMLLACIGAFCIGEYPEAVGVMLFYSIGEGLQHRAVDKATRDIFRLIDVRSERASVCRDGRYVSVSPRQVGIGETIEVKPGERVPLDGLLTEEEAVFDTSALTGESLPRLIRHNEEVLAGMIVSTDTIHIRVSRIYEKSALSSILDLVNRASDRKAPAERFIRKFARIYTPVVLSLAGLVIAVPAIVSLFDSEFQFVFSEWLYRSLVLLVISCPCALVISVPLSYFAGIGAASRNGILFKGGNYLDAITKINAIAFDKTGTLTTGNFGVERIVSPNLPENVFLSYLCAVERNSSHPIARAIVHYAQQRQSAQLSPERMREWAGYGAEAYVKDHHVQVGNMRMMQKHRIAIPPETAQETGTVILCSIDGQYAGHAVLSDIVKSDALPAIEAVRALGIEHITLLSGDKKEITEQLAHALRIPNAYGELLPEDKARYIEESSRMPGRFTAFVGDGLNDAPVLALSTVGIAMGALGSEAAVASADVVIQTDQPSKVATAIRIGRITRRIVIQNIAGAIAVKAVILLLGAAGYASLWGAVFADVGVALLAISNSLRILFHREQA